MTRRRHGSRQPDEATSSMAAPLCVLGLAFIVRVPFLFFGGFPADQAQFVIWSQVAKQRGLAAVYAPRPQRPDRPLCNYPPGYVLVLRGIADVASLIQGRLPDARTPELVLRQVRSPETDLATPLYKLPATAADALLAGLLVLWLTARIGRRPAFLAGLAYGLAPVAIHNSALWGQMDAIPTLFAAASLEAALRRRIAPMAVWATLAVLTKAQAMMLLPIWACAALVDARSRPARIVAPLVAAALAAALVTLPFAGAWYGVVQAYASAADYYPMTHLNGFSIWFLAHPLRAPLLTNQLETAYARDDVPMLFGLSPRIIGLSAIALVWFLVSVRLWRGRADGDSVRWASRVLPLAFFVLATQMHERYIFPAMALWLWSIGRSPRAWIGWLVLACAATINGVWTWPGPVDAWWTARLGPALHHTAVGISTSAVFAALSLASLVGWFEDRTGRPRREASPPSRLS